VHQALEVWTRQGTYYKTNRGLTCAYAVNHIPWPSVGGVDKLVVKINNVPCKGVSAHPSETVEPEAVVRMPADGPANEARPIPHGRENVII